MVTMEKNIDKILYSLSNSKFRASFHLKQKDILYVQAKGTQVIESHARDFVQTRLAAAYPKNDGKQTPMHSHPVFIAQHATATCCRDCLFKWHKIEKGRALSSEEFEYVIKLIMSWIEKEIQNANN